LHFSGVTSVARGGLSAYHERMVDPDELGRALYAVMDTIQHDWTRGPIQLEPRVRLHLVLQLRSTAAEINELLSRLEAQNT
jgi:hypothetical protein